jgi:hypothetical protein
MKTIRVIYFKQQYIQTMWQGRSNQFLLVDLAFQPEGQQLASSDLYFAYMMSSCVTVLLVEDRCCAHVHTPVGLTLSQ